MEKYSVTKDSPLGRVSPEKTPELIVFGALKFQQLLSSCQKKALPYLGGQSLT